MIGYVIVAAIGSLVGAAELISRYRDRPTSLVRVPGTWAYVLLNGSAAAGALFLIEAFDWQLGAKSTGSVEIVRVLVAGFGSMMVFRSALFTIRVGDEDVAVGPSTLLFSLLTAADRGVDRVQAKTRSQDAGRIMAGISFEKSRLALPTYCLGLLQNVSAEDQADLRTAVDALSGSEMTDGQKALNLGLLLMNVAGPDVLMAAVQTLRDEIRIAEGAESAEEPIPEGQPQLTQ
jgi:hypothetical protein